MDTKMKHTYVFPEWFAKRMNTVKMRTQMEASMLSLFLILIGMFLMVIYLVLYGEQSIFFKGLMIFNLVCGFALIGASLVTQYQQYHNYMETMGIDEEEEKRKLKELRRIKKMQDKAKKMGYELKPIQSNLPVSKLKKAKSGDVIIMDEAIKKVVRDQEKYIKANSPVETGERLGCPARSPGDKMGFFQKLKNKIIENRIKAKEKQMDELAQRMKLLKRLEAERRYAEE